MKFRVVRGLVGFLLTVLILCCVFKGVVEGRTKPGKVRCTTKTDRCCKLGRKAARHHLISPFYTCHYEALIAGLDHQTSVANRMRVSYRGRLKYTKTIVRTTAFRSRLASCYRPRNKKCFESCCNAKREAMIKASKQAVTKMVTKHVLTTPATKQKAAALNTKHVLTTPATMHVSPTNITETPKI